MYENNMLIEKIRTDFDLIALYEQEGWDWNNNYHKFLLKQLPLYFDKKIKGRFHQWKSSLLTYKSKVLVICLLVRVQPTHPKNYRSHHK